MLQVHRNRPSCKPEGRLETETDNRSVSRRGRVSVHAADHGRARVHGANARRLIVGGERTEIECELGRNDVFRSARPIPRCDAFACASSDVERGSPRKFARAPTTHQASSPRDNGTRRSRATVGTNPSRTSETPNASETLSDERAERGGGEHRTRGRREASSVSITAAPASGYPLRSRDSRPIDLARFSRRNGSIAV